MADPTARIAVLIDADNTSPTHAGALFDELARYGVPTVRRAYGDWTTQQLSGWKSVLPRHAIQPMQQFANTVGKNSTDSALIIDAMDLLYTGNVDAFAIVSSDSDFTRLAGRLREAGKTVLGFGRRRTPASLIAACDRFIFLEVLGRDDKSNDAAEPEEAGDLPDLQEIVTAAVKATARDDGWVSLGALGQFLNTADASFDSRNYNYPRLGALVKDQNYLDVDDRDGAPWVRLRSNRPAKKTTKKAQPAKQSQGTRKRGAASNGA